MKKVYVFLADGFEEIEALTPVDILRRAGADVVTVSVSDSKTVTGAHNVPVTADCTVADVADDADAIVLPGGYPGYENLAGCKPLIGIIENTLKKGNIIAAICGAPAAVLGRNGFLKDRCAVCYPGMEDELDCKRVRYSEVCVDGNMITAKSAACALNFALVITESLMGASITDKIKKGIVYNG